jgi:hypothetical protein
MNPKSDKVFADLRARDIGVGDMKDKQWLHTNAIYVDGIEQPAHSNRKCPIVADRTKCSYVDVSNTLLALRPRAGYDTSLPTRVSTLSQFRQRLASVL